MEEQDSRKYIGRGKEIARCWMYVDDASPDVERVVSIVSQEEWMLDTVNKSVSLDIAAL